MHPTPLWMLLAAGALVLGASAGCRGDETSSGGGGSGTTTGTGTGTGGSAQPLPLSIVTWNVHNLVDDHDDGAPDEWVESTAVWEAHRRAVGQVLAGLDADLVLLQEVEHQGILTELNAEELGGRYSELIVLPGNDPRGIDIGFMGKVPVAQAISHATDEFTRVGTPSPTYTYSRDCLEVHLTYNGRPLVVLGVHYKAKDNDNPDKRLAEAQHTRAIAEQLTSASPETGVLIVGDFNDVPGSLPYDWTVGIIQSAPELYVNAADDVAAADRWTFDYLGSRELVDQMFATPLLADMIEPGTAAIRHSSEVDAASDHAPLLATYAVR